MPTPTMPNPYAQPAPQPYIGDTMCEEAQREFLAKGGSAYIALAKKYKTGELQRYAGFVEFPKALNLSLGVREFDRSTEDVKGRTIAWTVRREIIWAAIVQDRAQEDEVLVAFDKAAELGIAIDPEWSAAQFLGIVAQNAATCASRRPVTAEDRRAARVAELRSELAALTGADNPLAASQSAGQPAKSRRAHRRTRPAAAAEQGAWAQPVSTDQDA